MNNAAFPGPEQMREMMADHHEMTFSILMPQQDVVDLLALSVATFQIECPSEPMTCQICNDANTVWWNACNQLSAPERRRLQAGIRAAGMKLPDAPWEVVSIG